ncbi:MAG: hypothetical protein JWO06_1468 [Bacteroidota bacterium]|nr:hypothetical protein [Bacteroidota bacterium]
MERFIVTTSKPDDKDQVRIFILDQRTSTVIHDWTYHKELEHMAKLLILEHYGHSQVRFNDEATEPAPDNTHNSDTNNVEDFAQ